MEEKNLKEKEVTYFYKHTVFVSVGKKKREITKKKTQKLSISFTVSKTVVLNICISPEFHIWSISIIELQLLF